MEYRVTLENFAGPLDLLLFLVRKEELDIHDIPIARVLDQYLEYLKLIQELDLDEAGEFLVMAATLMVVKSKMLLPQEQVDLEQEIDPRYELVKQLLEYKRFKDRVQALEERAEAYGKMVGRPETARVAPDAEPDRSLEDVSIFDLLKAFAKLMEQTGGGGANERVVTVDDRPVREYAERLVTRLKADRSVLFGELFTAEAPRREKIGYFLALLLLLKQQAAEMAQDGAYGDIRIFFKGDAVEPLEAADEFRA